MSGLPTPRRQSPTAVPVGVRSRRRQRGFTLIEILVTFSVVAVMLGLAAPSFVAFQRNAELTSAANSFLSAMTLARAEAMKRQLNTMVVPRASDDWAGGWRVFVDVDSNNLFDASTDTLLAEQSALSSVITVVTTAGANGFKDGKRQYVLFNGAGVTRLTGGGFQSDALQLTNGPESRLIIANPSGRMRVCKPSEPGCTGSDAL